MPFAMKLVYIIAATNHFDAQPAKCTSRVDGFDVMDHENNISTDATAALEVFFA
jgi:hypothetical protein